MTDLIEQYNADAKADQLRRDLSAANRLCELAGKREAAAWAERDQYLQSNRELSAEVQRLRVALQAISGHELRDWEDYEAIQEIATEALRSSV
jgi:hypothetical protein